MFDPSFICACTWCARVTLLSLALLFVGTPLGAQRAETPIDEPNRGEAGGKVEKPNPGKADEAWDRLTKAMPGRGPAGPTDRPDWETIAKDARRFQSDFPSHPQAKAAAKIEAISLLRADDVQPELSSGAVELAERYLNDLTHGTRDRLEVKVALDQSRLRRGSYASRGDRIAAHAAHARALIRDFPNEPEGYGYLLSHAKAESTRGGRGLAEELLATAAPAAFKQAAQRVIERLELVGEPLEITGAETLISEARGHALVVYSWAMKDEGFLNIIQSLEKTNGVRFIGVNLDADRQAAEQMAASMKLPGPQLYDGEGLDGPAARDLRLIMTASLYIVGDDGIVQDVNGHLDSQRKLTLLVLEQEGRP